MIRQVNLTIEYKIKVGKSTMNQVFKAMGVVAKGTEEEIKADSININRALRAAKKKFKKEDCRIIAVEHVKNLGSSIKEIKHNEI